MKHDAGCMCAGCVCGRVTIPDTQARTVRCLNCGKDFTSAGPCKPMCATCARCSACAVVRSKEGAEGCAFHTWKCPTCARSPCQCVKCLPGLTQAQRDAKLHLFAELVDAAWKHNQSGTFMCWESGGGPDVGVLRRKLGVELRRLAAELWPDTLPDDGSG